MKTIFVAINRGLIARNILRTGVLDSLLATPDVRIVLVINAEIHDYFRDEFSHPRIVFESVKNKQYSLFRRKLATIFNGLVYAETEKRKIKFGGGNRGPNHPVLFWFKHILFSILKRINVLKRLARWIELQLLIDRDFDYLFEKYSPDLVFCASLYSRGLDFVLLKAARRFGVMSVSMAKSWDTIGRLFMSAPADHIILQNAFMRDRVVKEQLISKDTLHVTGFPQFDIYHNKKDFLSKEEFCEITNLDPNKPTILFASEGVWTHWDDAYPEELIIEHNILDTYNLIVRPHWSNASKHIYRRFKKYDGVYVDDQNVRLTNMFGDGWDPTYADMDWLAEVINASDVVIALISTFVLDVMAMDKPVINIYYDRLPDREVDGIMVPIRELYDCVHYNAVLRGESTSLARNGQEVVNLIEDYLKNPQIKSDERRRTISELCYKIDGQSADRTAHVLLDLLK